MLSKPSCGWTDISIGEWSDRASYLTDVPIQFLDGFINHEYGVFALEFDAEGWDYTIVVNEYETYVIDYDYKEDKDMLDAKSDDLPNLKIFDIHKSALVTELIQDIENNLENWVHWECWHDFSENEDTDRRNEIISKINILKDRYKISK